MGKLVLGLDIGVTSVGYGVVDIENNVFVDYGVRLFKEGTAQNNLDRRTRRGSRRLIRRRANRIEDMKKLLEENGIKSEEYRALDNPYELRVKGLTQQLDNDELTSALLHLTKRRGSSLETVDDDDDGVTKQILADNKKLLGKDKFVCEVQLARLEADGKIRGNVNNFKTSDYIKETVEILKHQDLEDELKDAIIKLISRKRAYYDGPGSFKSPTEYGRFINVDGEIKEIDLIEKMRGKCSLFPEELRAPKSSYAAEYFNVLNDLNNLSVLGEKLQKEEKKSLLLYIEKNMGITPKQIAKILEVELDAISGFRVDKSGKALFTEMKGFKVIGKIFKLHQQIELLDDKMVINNVMDILTQTKGVEERINKIKDRHPELPDNLVSDLANVKGMAGYHAFSYKALNLISNEMLDTQMNQMQVIHQLEMFDKYRPSQKGKKNIAFDENAILSPVAVRAHKEALKLVNYLRKKYGEFDSIVIETTRDKNTAEQKKRINNSQKYFENRNKEVDELLKDGGFNPDLVNGKTKLKIKLYLEQNGKTIYTQSPIDLNRLIVDPNLYEIEHILPISISLDDSLSNKALASRMENQVKGNLSPLDAFAKGKFSAIGGDVERYRKFIMSSHNYNSKELRKKRDYLLYDEELNKFENAKEFIARNLVDTSYACRVVMNTLQNYFKDNEIPTNVHTVKGKFTGMFRNRIDMNKEREADYLHHAIDALIVASIKKIPVISTYFRKFKLEDIYDESTGEILNVENADAVMSSQYIQFISTLKNIYNESNKYYNGLMKRDDMNYGPIKISHKIDTKPNRQLFDETIYSTRTVNGHEMLTETYRDIYEPKFSKLTDDIINNRAVEKYIMATKDPETFKMIEMIVMNHFNTYKDDGKFYAYDNKKDLYGLKGENPLTAYKQEFGKVRKYSKKGNGPEITKIRFYSEKLGNHVDISHNYHTKGKKVIVKQISPYRTDIYQSPEGKYNFVTIRYKDVRYVKSKDKNVIDQTWYKEQKEQKGIGDDWKFICSLHRDELVAIKKKPGDKFIYDSSTENNGTTVYHDGEVCEILKFTATNNDNTGRFEVNPIYTYSKKQLMVSIGPISSMEKISTDVAGKMYKVTNNVLKFEF